jgi:hypothetical protein
MAVEKKKNVEVEKKRTKELQNKISDLELELKKAKKDVDKISDLELELKKAKGRGEGDRQAWSTGGRGRGSEVSTTWRSAGC